MPSKEVTRRCELCAQAAVVYCPSDSAFLCCRCDSAVHSANFLVARHLRSVLCCSCGDFHGDLVSGAGVRRCGGRSLCRSCGALASEDADESSLSSDCISSTESSTVGRPTKQRREQCFGEVSSEKIRTKDRRGRVDVKVDGILVNWCRRMGLDRNQEELVTEMAAQVLGMSHLRRLTCVPVRVALAAAFWMGVRMCGDNAASTCQDLKRVERVTGVPAKMILAVEAKLRRVWKTRRGVTATESDYQEGWAEC